MLLCVHMSGSFQPSSSPCLLLPPAFRGPREAYFIKTFDRAAPSIIHTHARARRILGDSFLRTFYTAYNVEDKTVGVAKATALRTGDECAADAPISASGTPAAGATGDGGDAPAAAEAAPAVTPAPALASAETATTASTSSAGPAAEESEISVVPTPAPQEVATSSGPAYDTDGSNIESGDSSGGNGEGDESGIEQGGSSSSDGGSAAGANLGGSGAAGDSGDDEADGGPSLAAVAAAASVGTLLGVAFCGGLAVLVVRRIRRGEYRHTQLGSGGGALELGGKGGRGGGGSTVVGAEDDFLQAGPGGYRGSGSGSHRYRVAAETGVAHDRGSADRVTVLGTDRGGEDEDEGEPDDEIEVDFGVSRATGGATPSVGSLGRMFGRGGARGFTAFRNEEGGGLVDEQSSGL